MTATTVTAMMANSDNYSARPRKHQLRGSDNNNSKGNEEDEGGKGDGDGSFNDNGG